MENERRIGSDGIKVSAMAQRGPMAMNWRPFPCPEKTVSPPVEVPLRLQDVLNWDAVGKSTAFLTTYCSQPPKLEFDTRIVGGALKGVVKLI
jgi:hypothetical protein